jgi:hypothetical protein
MRQTEDQGISEGLHAKVEPVHGAAKKVAVAEMADETSRVLGAPGRSRGTGTEAMWKKSCVKVRTLDFTAVATTAIQLVSSQAARSTVIWMRTSRAT